MKCIKELVKLNRHYFCLMLIWSVEYIVLNVGIGTYVDSYNVKLLK